MQVFHSLYIFDCGFRAKLGQWPEREWATTEAQCKFWSFYRVWRGENPPQICSALPTCFRDQQVYPVLPTYFWDPQIYPVMPANLPLPPNFKIIIAVSVRNGKFKKKISSYDCATIPVAFNEILKCFKQVVKLVAEILWGAESLNRPFRSKPPSPRTKS